MVSWWLLVYALVGVNLLWLAVEDYRYQQVPVIGLLTYGGLGFLSRFQQWPATGSLADVIINVAFVGVQFVLVWLYLQWRRPALDLGKSIGSGDLIFIAIGILCWNSYVFLAAYLGGLISGLLLGAWQTMGWPDRQQPIPLITTLASAQLLSTSCFLILNYY